MVFSQPRGRERDLRVCYFLERERGKMEAQRESERVDAREPKSSQFLRAISCLLSSFFVLLLLCFFLLLCVSSPHLSLCFFLFTLFLRIICCPPCPVFYISSAPCLRELNSTSFSPFLFSILHELGSASSSASHFSPSVFMYLQLPCPRLPLCPVFLHLISSLCVLNPPIL